MAKKSTSFTIYQQGKADMSRLPLHIGLELIRRLNQKHEKNHQKLHLVYVNMPARK